jgi:hypothetical protein
VSPDLHRLDPLLADVRRSQDRLRLRLAALEEWLDRHESSTRQGDSDE